MSLVKKTYLNLNTAFALFLKLGVTRDLQARAVVREVTYPKLGVRVSLILDYATTHTAPSSANGYAIACTYLFDGLTKTQYEQVIRTAKKVHSTITDIGSKAAEMHALELLVSHESAVCLHRDELVLRTIEQAVPKDHCAPSDEAIAAIRCAPIYTGSNLLNGTEGLVTPESAAHHLGVTLAEGSCCHTAEMIEEACAQGVHPNWEAVDRRRTDLAERKRGYAA